MEEKLMSPNFYTLYLYILPSFYNYNTLSLIFQSTEPIRTQVTTDPYVCWIYYCHLV
jgi:hypothetical protein